MKTIIIAAAMTVALGLLVVSPALGGGQYGGGCSCEGKPGPKGDKDHKVLKGRRAFPVPRVPVAHRVSPVTRAIRGRRVTRGHKVHRASPERREPSSRP